MQAPDTIARSAEHLRQAVARMARHPAAFHPLTYAVWYEYVSGANAALARAIESHAGPFDDAAIQALFTEYVADTDVAALERARGAVDRMADEVSACARDTGVQAGQFGHRLHAVREALAGRAGRLGRGDEALEALLAGTIGQAQALAESAQTMAARLDHSRQEVAALREQLDQAREAALTDSLTGLANRRRLQQALAELGRSGTDASCVLLIDLDRFGRLNDAFGNLFGDRVLTAVGHAVRDLVPEPGFAARWEGAAFAVLLPGQTLAQATRLGERVLERIERIRVRRKGYVEPIGQITVSIGTAQRQPAERSDALMARAAEALAHSKRTGRDRMAVAAGEPVALEATLDS